MNRKTKIGLIGGALLLGAIALSGCTQSFCSTLDKAHMLFAFDFGATKYYAADDANRPSEATQIEVNGTTLDIYSYTDYSNCSALNTIINNAAKNNIAAPSDNYFKAFDQLVLEYVVTKESINVNDITVVNGRYHEGNYENTLDVLVNFGYYKFYYNIPVDNGVENAEPLNRFNTAIRWANWDYFNAEVRKDEAIGVDELPNSDFVAFYKKQMQTYVNAYRSCLATNDGIYGYYGVAGNRNPIDIEAKDYAYGWRRGFFEGLLIWPIGALADVVTNNFRSAFPQNDVARGWAAVLAIVVVTVIVRTVLAALTFQQTANNAKMTELQPEIQKIQAKYPNANTNNNERMRLSQDTQALYKKHGVHPLSSMLVMIVQFPVFICVWGALQGSAALSTGSFLGLNLSESISSVLFSAVGWQSGAAVTALVLFLLMAGAQAASMLLPQYLQKRKAAKVAKLGKNPAAAQNDKRMKYFQYGMLGMIVLMGFSLASGMGIYWFVSAIFSLIQTLITQAITSKLKKKKKEKR